MKARSWWAAARSGSDSSRCSSSRRASRHRAARASPAEASPRAHEGPREVLPRVGEVGIDPERRPELRLGRVGAPEGEQGLAEVRVPLREVRREPNRPLEPCASPGEVLARAGDHAEAVQRLGQVGAELERVLEGDLGALAVARLEVCPAAVELLRGAGVKGSATGAAAEEEREGGGQQL